MQTKLAERFNPWRRFRGIMIPDPVMASDLSLGAKVCYGVLVRFAGERGECWPTMQTIGTRIGVSGRQAKSYIAELAASGFIARRRGGMGRPNRYSFLRHASFDSAEGKKFSPETGSSLPAERGGWLPTEESHQQIHIRESEDLDYLATHRKKRDASPDYRAPQPSNCKDLADLIAKLLERRPSQSSLGQIISATPSRRESEALEAIQEAVGRGYGADSKHGPRSASWFVSVVRNYWQDRKRRALPPSAPHALVDSSEFDRMTNAFDPLEDAT